MFIKKIIFASLFAIFSVFNTTEVKATDECFENVSRSIFKFNMVLDDIVLEPLAKGYNKLPSPIKTGAGNFTSNISNLLSIPNSLLQGNIKQAGHATGSFLINTTVGFP